MQGNQLFAVSRYSASITCGRYLGTVMRFGSFARTSLLAFASISAFVRCPAMRFRACLMSTVPSASRGIGLLAGISLTSLSNLRSIGKKSRTNGGLRSRAPRRKTFQGWGDPEKS